MLLWSPASSVRVPEDFILVNCAVFPDYPHAIRGPAWAAALWTDQRARLHRTADSGLTPLKQSPCQTRQTGQYHRLAWPGFAACRTSGRLISCLPMISQTEFGQTGAGPDAGADYLQAQLDHAQTGKNPPAYPSLLGQQRLGVAWHLTNLFRGPRRPPLCNVL